jgi:putative Holliday junction resolvase
MRVLGIDFGERRIGIAISDPGGSFALPLTTLPRRDDASAVREIAALAREEGIGRIVVGEPLRADGSAGSAALRARGFAARLARETGLPVDTTDESLTSREADRKLAEAGVPPAKRAGKRDALAAQLLLQQALDGRHPGDA